ncbi:MAG: hypothetical protein EOO80_16135 [Oxalobacteraceae bacterium]|nr:MAG: hypothetical protein EOO80_16135 [Oxalobacteraceae bacterium]
MSCAEPEPRPPFGTWLLQQNKRDGWIGEGRKGRPGIPRHGDPEAVRKRLRELQADGDMFEAVDDAELEWLSY